MLRKSSKAADKSIVAELFTILNSEPGIWRQLDSTGFCIVLSATLQAESSQQKERSILVLTVRQPPFIPTTTLTQKASMCDDASDAAISKLLEEKKTLIYQNLLLILLDCFVDEKENYSIRKWASCI